MPGAQALHPPPSGLLWALVAGGATFLLFWGLWDTRSPPAFLAPGVRCSLAIPPASSLVPSLLPLFSPPFLPLFWLLIAELSCPQRNPVSLVQGLDSSLPETLTAGWRPGPSA